MKKITSPFILIKRSYEIFSKKENFLFLVQIYIPLGLLALISLIFNYIPFLANFFSTNTGNVVTFIFNLIFIFVVVLVNLAGISAIMKIENGKKLDTREVYKNSISKYKVFFLLTIVTYLIYALGLVLLIVPFVLVVTWLTFSKFINVEKGIGIKKSFIESKGMVKGNFWKVFIRIFVFSIFSLCSQIILSVLPFGIGVVVFNLFGALFILPSYLLYREMASKTAFSE